MYTQRAEPAAGEDCQIRTFASSQTGAERGFGVIYCTEQEQNGLAVSSSTCHGFVRSRVDGRSER